MLGLNLTDLEIGSMNKAKFKKIVESHVNQAAFCYLKSLKEGHSKMEGLNYSKFEKAAYELPLVQY